MVLSPCKKPPISENDDTPPNPIAVQKHITIPIDQKKQSSSSAWIIVTIVIGTLTLIALILSGYFIYKSTKNNIGSKQ
jgi:hypothetical protein